MDEIGSRAAGRIGRDVRVLIHEMLKIFHSDAPLATEFDRAQTIQERIVLSFTFRRAAVS